MFFYTIKGLKSWDITTAMATFLKPEYFLPNQKGFDGSI